MGRTEWSNEGLLTYKDRWGGRRSKLQYLRHSFGGRRSSKGDAAKRIASQALTLMPARLFTAAGEVLYRHFA
jgi:hypothetical protein